MDESRWLADTAHSPWRGEGIQSLTPVFSACSPQTTISPLHIPQQELALQYSHHPAWMGVSHRVPVKTHSTPVLPKREEAVGCSQLLKMSPQRSQKLRPQKNQIFELPTRKEKTKKKKERKTEFFFLFFFRFVFFLFFFFLFWSPSPILGWVVSPPLLVGGPPPCCWLGRYPTSLPSWLGGLPFPFWLGGPPSPFLGCGLPFPFLVGRCPLTLSWLRVSLLLLGWAVSPPLLVGGGRGEGPSSLTLLGQAVFTSLS